MTRYITSIIGAAALAGTASVLSPEKWKKYVGIITGIVIICTVLSPFMKTNITGVFDDFNTRFTASELEKGEQIRLDMIKSQLAEGINTDIENRMREEFHLKVKAKTDIGINDEGKITGVNEIEIDGRLSNAAKNRLCEVYGIGADKIIQAD